MSDASDTEQSRQRRELRSFLFLTVVLFPLLAVLVVASFAAMMWIWHMIVGPPGG
ncbi:MAG: periplasmic nitrate reductase, NapE protein [Rhodanobacteraceae bacterium]|nr:periplasmic nitrate reductase, NapE protein [Rhodanobacteraceae bacterium]